MFSGLTNQVSSWMGAVKGEEGGEAAAGAPENADPAQQSEVAADAGEQQFENVPVGEEGEGAKATRCVNKTKRWCYHHHYIISLKCRYFERITTTTTEETFHFLFFFVLVFIFVAQQKVLVYFQMCNQKWAVGCPQCLQCRCQRCLRCPQCQTLHCPMLVCQTYPVWKRIAQAAMLKVLLKQPKMRAVLLAAPVVAMMMKIDLGISGMWALQTKWKRFFCKHKTVTPTTTNKPISIKYFSASLDSNI